MKKFLIFDLDGTLADTLSMCVETFQDALFEMTGRRPTENEVYTYFGYTEESISKNLFPSNWEDYFAHYIKIYEKRLRNSDLKPFDGIIEMFEKFKKEGFKLALVTAKGKVAADITLDVLNMKDYFEFVKYGVSEVSNKPEMITEILKEWKVQPTEVYYIGDSYTDVRDAKIVGVNQVAVAWASTANKEKLINSNPTVLFDFVDDFAAWALT